MSEINKAETHLSQVYLIWQLVVAWRLVCADICLSDGLSTLQVGTCGEAHTPDFVHQLCYLLLHDDPL